MDQGQFDALMRSVAGGAGTRRAIFRLLAGGALGGMATRFGLVAVADAKGKKHTSTKKEERRSPQAARKGHSPLRAEGRRKKRRGKNRNRTRPCDDLTAPLCGTCAEPICLTGDWACKVIGDTDCGNGVCVWDGECCPDKYRCDDGTCVDPLDECCPEQQPCPGGSCADPGECCPDWKKCPGYTECFAAEDCCPNAVPPLCAKCDKVVCESGSLVCRPKTAVCPSPENEKVCCNGDLVCRGSWDLPERCATYTPERTYNPANCRCQCPPNTNDSLGLCCPLGFHATTGSNGNCIRFKDDGTYDSVCALGYSEVRGVCRRT